MAMPGKPPINSIMYRVRVAWLGIRARIALGGLKASPEAKLAMRERFIENFVRQRLAGREKNPGTAANGTVVNGTAKNPGSAVPVGQGYAHEKLPTETSRVVIGRKPGDLDMARASKSTRIEAELRAKTKAQLVQAKEALKKKK